MPSQGLHSLATIYIFKSLVVVGTTLPLELFPPYPMSFLPSLLDVMASDDIAIPQIAIIGVEDNNHATPTRALPYPSSHSPRPPHSPLGYATSLIDNQGFLSSPTPAPKSVRNFLDAIGPPSSHTPDISSQPPPCPTLSAHSAGSIRFANSTVLRENNPEELDGISCLELLAPPPPHHRRMGSVTTASVGSSSTEREYEANQSFGLSPVPSAHSETCILPSPTQTHVDVVSDVSSLSSLPARHLRMTSHRVRRSPSPSGETGTGSETMRNDWQKGDNSDVKFNGPELTGPEVLDLKQEEDMDVHPFAFKMLPLAILIDPKSLETPECMGDVDAILRGLGAQPPYGLSTEHAPPPGHAGSPDPTFQDESHAADKDPPKPNIVVTSPATGVPHGSQSTASLASGSGVSLPTAFQFSEEVYRTSIEDRKRIFGQNIVPRRPSKTLLQLMWLALKDKVLVRQMCSAYSNV